MPSSPETLRQVMVRGIERTALFRMPPTAPTSWPVWRLSRQRKAPHAARWQAEIPKWCC